MRKPRVRRFVSMAVIGVLAAGSALFAVPSAHADETAPRIDPVQIALTDSSAELTAEAVAGKASAPADLAPGTTAAGSAVLTDQIETGEFTVSALTWNAESQLPDGNVAYFRVLEATGWSSWSGLGAAEEDSESAGAAAGSAPFISGVATAIQVQVTGEATTLPAELTLVIAELGTASGDSSSSQAGRIGPQSESVPYTQSGTTTPGREGIARGIRPRSDWDKQSPAPTWDKESAKLRAAIVHHTAGTNNYGRANVPGIIASIYYYHAITLGWGDIGYNFLVDKYGGMWEGRQGSLDVAADSMVIGGHAYGSNNGTMGVSVLGEYSYVTPSPAVMDAFTKIIEYRFDLAGLDARDKSGFTSTSGVALPRIFGHRDVYATECPGAQIYPRLAGLVQRVGAPRSTITGWFKDRGTWYYIYSDGWTATGWVNDYGTWYYLNSNGAMATGWLNLGGTWYYLRDSGAMATGWIKDYGTWYYLTSDGAMATGWQKVDGTWYYLNSNGAMVTGWLHLGGKWYYLRENGAMATGWITVDGGRYYMDSSGAWA